MVTPRELRALPKAHLHTHLESTLRPGTIEEWGGVAPAAAVFSGVPIYPDFRAFGDERAAVRDLLNTPERFRRAAYEFCQDEAAQGVRYAEVTFTAAAHGERTGQARMPLEAVLEGLEEGERDFGLRTAVLLDHSRRRSTDRLARTVDLALAYEQVVGVGLAGDESHPLSPFARELDRARAEGLHLVHHAGESAGADSVREALEVGHAERLGHGIRVLDDPGLVARVRELGVPLEVCPSSNVMLSLAPSWAEHPLPRLIEAGLNVTLNTDGECALNGEYASAREIFGFGDDVLAELARASVRASFAPDTVKKEILAEIDAWAR
ncbi:adenosine deaminase [Nonomuraea soli]|uniref:Adenosine deaminase n=1 Tax=Nonomuraea soli TaxID=1032476 RepID=A0A7W0CSC2_9ACTN|nr:adenosine deaminase [Nonomuraea soli]MBA2896443.1 adenosine deaminase [Nonomuraea soli]